jgi:type I restriction enzyme, S subunit
MEKTEVPFADLLAHVVDNRGRTCPTAPTGRPLIATNCISNDRLYPSYDTERFVSEETFHTWFRGHPIPGDLVFVCKGSPGRVALAPNPVDFCIAQDMVALRADFDRVYPKFLLAVLRSPEVQRRIEGMHVGSLIPHFKKGDFGKLLIPLPDRQTQIDAGDTYYDLSEKIEQNRRTGRALERLARAIFRAWFVDFEPVKVKTEGGDSFVSMPQAAFDALPFGFVDSEIGPVPKSWQVTALSRTCTLVGGGTPKRSERSHWGGKVPWYSVKDALKASLMRDCPIARRDWFPRDARLFRREELSGSWQWQERRWPSINPAMG